MNIYYLLFLFILIYQNECSQIMEFKLFIILICIIIIFILIEVNFNLKK